MIDSVASMAPAGLASPFGELYVRAYRWMQLARVLDDKLRPAGDRILFQLLGYVSWQARAMWMLNEGEEAKVRTGAATKAALARTAKRIGRAGIARIIEITLGANLGVISGARRPDDTLEVYVAELAAILQPEAGQAGRRP